MDERTSIELLRNMLGIYSPSGKEESLAGFLQEELQTLGFESVWTDKVGNVYGQMGSGSPTILLCGHMDTVPGRIPVRLYGDRLYGRGAVDAKASLAAMISAASSLGKAMVKGSVIVAGVVQEEKKARGIRQLSREGLKVDQAVFGEPSGVKNITFAYKGKIGLRFTFKTVSGHVGAQHLVRNAVEESFSLWNVLKASYKKNESSQGVFYSLTACLTGIDSRRTSGSVPDLCVLDVDLRLPPTIESENVVSIAREVVDRFEAEKQDVTVSMKVTDKVDPFVARRDTVLMKTLEKAILYVTGGPVRFLRKTGTGDMNVFGAETGIPVATYGPGNTRLSHTQQEHINLTEYLASIQVYRKTVEGLLSYVGC